MSILINGISIVKEECYAKMVQEINGYFNISFSI